MLYSFFFFFSLACSLKLSCAGSLLGRVVNLSAQSDGQERSSVILSRYTQTHGCKSWAVFPSVLVIGRLDMVAWRGSGGGRPSWTRVHTHKRWHGGDVICWWIVHLTSSYVGCRHAHLPDCLQEFRTGYAKKKKKSSERAARVTGMFLRLSLLLLLLLLIESKSLRHDLKTNNITRPKKNHDTVIFLNFLIIANTNLFACD